VGRRRLAGHPGGASGLDMCLTGGASRADALSQVQRIERTYRRPPDFGG
jgi:hypothetical protein